MFIHIYAMAMLLTHCYNLFLVSCIWKSRLYILLQSRSVGTIVFFNKNKLNLIILKSNFIAFLNCLLYHPSPLSLSLSPVFHTTGSTEPFHHKRNEENRGVKVLPGPLSRLLLNRVCEFFPRPSCTNWLPCRSSLCLHAIRQHPHLPRKRPSGD